ncbi:protein ANTAGONIST OF LIKE HETEROCHROMATIN PROTEIN 1-like [Anneissia japonica]|uniref:protein ANTAGONIST OF LIKE HETEROCHROMATIN PROTEIN 1-like n=1 Tax=Anneissia japonica TaxID=1529436 RepID=UPI001425B9FA|nr:protein ANTAGONIST OF LIKE HETEROCHROMATIN PROTEIN 1-like [Anneissia japonica]
MNGELFPRQTQLINGVQVPIMILGDPAYPLNNWLMKGFPDRDNMPNAHRRFNYRLSKARMVVERSFGMLKGRWRILMKRNDSELKHIPNMVLACCILHNMCIENGDVYNPSWDDENEDEVEQPQHQAEDRPINNATGNEIREALVDYFGNL